VFVGKWSACFELIRRLPKLKEGWDGAGAAPPNAESIRNSRQLLRAMVNYGGLPVPAIAPSVEEGICISFHENEMYADIECFNSGEVIGATSDGRGGHEIWEIDLSDAAIDESFDRIKRRIRPQC
jgi:hypothetical protein